MGESFFYIIYQTKVLVPNTLPFESICLNGSYPSVTTRWLFQVRTWSVDRVLDASQRLREEAATLYRQNRSDDAFHLYASALKVLIPVEVRLLATTAAAAAAAATAGAAGAVEQQTTDAPPGKRRTRSTLFSVSPSVNYVNIFSSCQRTERSQVFMRTLEFLSFLQGSRLLSSFFYPKRLHFHNEVVRPVLASDP